MYVKTQDSGMTFTRGEYSIPANYRGNAFTADEAPTAVNDSYNEESEHTEEITESIDQGIMEASAPKEPSRETESPPLAADDLLIAGLILLMLINSDTDLGKSAVMVLILCRLLFGS